MGVIIEIRYSEDKIVRITFRLSNRNLCKLEAVPE